MKPISRRLCLSLTAALGCTLGFVDAAQAQAQDFPTRPITIVVPYAAGGATDITARRFAEGLGRRLSTTVVVDNKPGAATAIGAAYVARAPKDGYTLLFAPGTTTSVNPHLYGKLSYQLSDFAPISMVSRQTFVLSVGAGHPAKTFRELMAYGKGKPDGLTYGTTGTGSMTNIIGEWVGKTTGLKLVEVPYKGTAPATVDVISGRIDMQFEGITSTASMAGSGKMRPLVVMADKPSPLLPSVPTFRDEGYPDLVAFTNFGLLAPKGTPGAVIDKLHAATVATVASPAFTDSLAASGEAAVSSPSPRQFASFLNEEFEHWGRIIKPMNIKLD
ncbi:tripartite tricarboxylate transporter substrate binding protein [uncultured Pseudacidovorax sp.]|uniref:Bug family tripartite tricarboxylate transporter substrate binding protein n=1 Tax=uncultured Pseudacidovorax sp. TaxID=679313 RepID=UPI0025D011A3|nr:tripartite tricarboxylate transporter substrate binding protein [uncultured Pseudacidovorax sp.]